MLLGAWELLVVAVAALLLLGPEKLPELMRTVARFVAQAQRLVSEAKQSVSDALNEEHEPTSSQDRSVYQEDDRGAVFSDWAQKATEQEAADKAQSPDEGKPMSEAKAEQNQTSDAATSSDSQSPDASKKEGT